MKSISSLKVMLLIFYSLLIVDISAFSGEKHYTFTELIIKSDLIVRGKVISLKSYKKEKGRIYSDIVFRVTKTYKGQKIDNEEITFTFMGGTVDGITTFIIEYPQFIKNQESILFLNRYSIEYNKQQKYVIAGLSQGKFNIYQDNKNNFIVRRDQFAGYNIEIVKEGKGMLLNNSNHVSLNDFIGYLENSIQKQTLK